MSRDPLVDVRDDEDSRAAYLDGLVEHRPPPAPRRTAVPEYATLGGVNGGCWCGREYGHDWLGKDDGAPHPR